MKFRRSAKASSNKSLDLRSQHNSVPEKSLLAIQPPKKVIRALYDYQVPDPHNNTGYLSFSQGDFLHVVGRENDPDWYEACNPLHGTRGLVPANFFEEIGKQARRSANQPQDRSSGSHHDSGYAEKVSQRGSLNDEPHDGSGQSRAKTPSRGNVAMIYGSLMYDFHAERPDELEAKAGENIVVIAQSTHEWFVAKPITRLGGPGLIPVSYIQIRDTATGLPVEDVQEAVRKAGIPRVEEWKKMVADYKASSIPLGRLDTQGQNLAQNMERLNISNDNRSQSDLSQRGVDVQRNTYPPVGYAQSQPPQQHQQQQSQQQQQQQQQSQQQPQPQQPQAQQQQQQNPPFRTSQMIAPVRAKVSGISQTEADFWFSVEAVMEDGRTLALKRSYKDFYGLQMHLIEQFPEIAGKVDGYRRTLPYMPGPVPWVTEKLTKERRGHLDKYIRDLLKIDPMITNSQVVRMFFYPREDDNELQAEEDEMGYRLSAVSHASSAAAGSSTHSSSGTMSIGPGAGSGPSNTQRQQPYQAQNTQGAQRMPSGQYRVQSADSDSSLAAPPPLLRNNSSMSSGLDNGGNGTNAAKQMASHANASPVKVKVWFGEHNCVMIRLPPTYDYTDLVGKLRDRWSLEDKANVQGVNFVIDYRDDGSQQFYRIEGNDDLAVAKERNEKLTLRVAAVLGMV